MMVQCPYCKEAGDDTPGDLKMCAECGLWSRLEDGHLRRLTRDELREVAGAFAKFLRTQKGFLS